MSRFLKRNGQPLDGPTRAALIGAAATVLVAVITGLFGLAQAGYFGGREPAPVALPSPTALASPTAEEASAPLRPTVRVEGATAAPLDERTFFTIVSENAVRAEWSIGGFVDEPVVVEPLNPSHEIFVEPTNAERAGDSFTLVVIVYDEDGQAARAEHRFEVVDGG